MICDRVRTEAFERAIRAVVRPGDVVLDVGAGSGILSLFAARAGAARVYAVERTTVAVLAQDLAEANGFGEVIEVIHGDLMDIELPEKVDVIVSEWLGGFGIDEGMLTPVIVARDRWLKPGGVMIPASVTAWAGLVHDRYLSDTVDFLREPPVRPRPRTARRDDGQRDLLLRHLPPPRRRRQPLATGPAVDDRRAHHPARAGASTSRGGGRARGPRRRDGQRPGSLVQRGACPWRLPVHRSRRPTHSLGDDHGPASMGHRTRAPDVRPGQGPHGSGAADGDVDPVGHRDARWRLGGARRAVGLGGDRRLRRGWPPALLSGATVRRRASPA